MRWFVTEAQLAALRAAIRDEVTGLVWQQWNATQASHDAEIERLRADRAAEVARMTDPQGPFVQHLRDEVAFWRHQFLHERQRTEVAMDQCRVTHQSIGPVSLPLREDAVKATGTPLDIFRDPELAAMGLADGLP